MKRKWTALMGTVALCGMLAACGNEEQDAQTEASTEDEKIELTFWYAYADKIQEANDELVERFNESQDRIEVTASTQGSYTEVEQKVRQSMVAGNEPDVFITVINSVSGLAKDGVVEDLTPFIEGDDTFEKDDFIEGILASSNIDGSYYGLPYFNSTPLVYYNKDLFDAAGVDPAQLNTWEGFQQAAAQLTKDGVIGGTQEETFWLFEANMNQQNSKMFSDDKKQSLFATEEGVASVDFTMDMVKEGTWEFPIGDQGIEKAVQSFETQKAAILLASTSRLSQFAESAEAAGFEMGVMMLPEGDKRAVAVGGSNIVMTGNLEEEEQEAAWEFIEFVTNAESNSWATEHTGYLPIRHSIANSEERQALEAAQPFYAVAREQLEYAVPGESVPGFNEITSIWRESVEALIADPDLTTKEAMEMADMRVTDVLNQ